MNWYKLGLLWVNQKKAYSLKSEKGSGSYIQIKDKETLTERWQWKTFQRTYRKIRF